LKTCLPGLLLADGTLTGALSKRQAIRLLNTHKE